MDLVYALPIMLSLQIPLPPTFTHICNLHVSICTLSQRRRPCSSCIFPLSLLPSLSPGYVEGTFSLVWKKRGGSSSSTEEEQELFEKSTATLFETGMEGGKEYLVIRKKDGVVLEKKTVRISYLQWGIF